MLAEVQTFEKLLSQVNRLSPENRIKLIQHITSSLLPYPAPQSTPLQFGKYGDNRMSTSDDFVVAEWHPSEDG